MLVLRQYLSCICNLLFSCGRPHNGFYKVLSIFTLFDLCLIIEADNYVYTLCVIYLCHLSVTLFVLPSAVLFTMFVFFCANILLWIKLNIETERLIYFQLILTILVRYQQIFVEKIVMCLVLFYCWHWIQIFWVIWRFVRGPVLLRQGVCC